MWKFQGISLAIWVASGMMALGAESDISISGVEQGVSGGMARDQDLQVDVKPIGCICPGMGTGR